MGEIIITCPHCAAQGSIDDGMAGRQISCRKCGTAFPVMAPAPAPTTQAAAPAAPPHPANACPSCGSPLAAQGTFCPACGAKIANTAPLPDQPIVSSYGSPRAMIASNSKTIWLLALAAVVIIVVVLLVGKNRLVGKWEIIQSTGNNSLGDVGGTIEFSDKGTVQFGFAGCDYRWVDGEHLEFSFGIISEVMAAHLSGDTLTITDHNSTVTFVRYVPITPSVKYLQGEWASQSYPDHYFGSSIIHNMLFADTTFPNPQAGSFMNSIGINEPFDERMDISGSTITLFQTPNPANPYSTAETSVVTIANCSCQLLDSELMIHCAGDLNYSYVDLQFGVPSNQSPRQSKDFSFAIDKKFHIVAIGRMVITLANEKGNQFKLYRKSAYPG